MGEVCIIPENLECCLGQRMVLLKADPEICANKYLLYTLMSQEVQHQISWSKGTGTTVSNLRIPHLESLDIPYIPLAEQRAIAATLSCLDDKIELNNKINTNLEAQAQAIFKSWFVDFEPFQDGEFEDSELGAVPKGWKIVKFSQFLNAVSEKTGDEAIPEYSVTNAGIFPREKTFKKRLSKDSKKNKLVKKNNLVFGMSREILNWGLMKDIIGGVSSAYHVFSIDEDIVSPQYVEEFMRSNIWYFKDLIRPGAREGQGIDKGALLSKNICIPPKHVYQEYVNIRDSLTTVITNINKQSRTLAALRDTLLPKLMSGEIEVPTAEAAL